MKFLPLFLFILLLPQAARAELYSDKPYCAIIKNETSNKSFVAIRTDFYAKPDGSRSYFEEVMHIEPGKDKQVCVKGPFFPDYKVTLIIKSFFPLFECKTKLQGEIPVRERKREDGGRDFYAVCIE